MDSDGKLHWEDELKEDLNVPSKSDNVDEGGFHQALGKESRIFIWKYKK